MEGGANHHRRVAQACDACKRRKVRCNGEQRCQQCDHLNLKCIYTPAGRRVRKNAAERGTVIESYRRSTGSAYSPTSPVSLAPAPTSPTIIATPAHTPSTLPSTPSVSIHPNLSFFLDLVPAYLLCVYPVNPVVSEAEIRACIHQIDADRDAASFVYAFAAVTINLTRTDSIQSAPDVRDQISALLSRSFEFRTTMVFESQPTVLKLMGSIFIEICLMALRKFNLAFFYLREAISMVHMLRIENVGDMAALDLSERARRQRAYWECFIHERFSALSDYKPICLDPLPNMPEHDPSISPAVEHGWNHIIQTFVLVDKEFVTFWIGDRSHVTPEWIERKHRQLEDDQWQMEVSALSAMQQADLIITRQWLRTLTWQMAMSNTLLSSSPQSESLSLTLPLRLSSQLRQFLGHMSHDAISIHGSGILSKLFEITDTIADVVIHLPQASREETLQRVDDILFLKRFIFSFPRIEVKHKQFLGQKFEKMKEVYPEMAEIDMLVNSPLST
ncbi:hypothetical protein AOQ84DRAFT_422513 [Glonium stellatum]|uniref:Zn(2)-C6 fungal-type domain-containing protein n=1 Tax=Glonium stellatum TaxID=574774 RepID=A0A8E2F792_9PEZI|nr:hypothetical protein AOQ84DRAFT_422513 [Glonium stellatum]